MIKVRWGRKSPWWNPVITTDNQCIIKLAWGPRRVSSKAASGTKAYPEDVGAALSMWLAWTRKNWHRKEPYIVITSDPESGHGARYREELKEEKLKQQKIEEKEAMALRIDDLQRERMEARAAKDFARADAIRDEIEQAGFVVSDKPISEVHKITKETVNDTKTNI